MRREIIQFPNPRLKLRSKEVDAVNGIPELDHCIRDLMDTFQSFPRGMCIGLAAPQIGIEKRIIVVDVSLSHSDTYLMLNPVIVKESGQQRVEDGCMSVGEGKEHYVTRRPKTIVVSWITHTYMERKQKFSGLIAACIHHEIDHLDGLLMFDRAVSVQRVAG